jgi:hypothetical protein
MGASVGGFATDAATGGWQPRSGAGEEHRSDGAVPFERYADDGICHCKTLAQAQQLRAALERRFAECHLELHP